LLARLDAFAKKRDKERMNDTSAAAAKLSASRASAPLRGRALMAGDKSISHRALILGAAATGTTTIHGLLEGDDVLATLAAMQALGAQVTKLGDGQYEVVGVGPMGFKTPAQPLDFGNAGTGARLVMGLVAGAGLEAEFIGDASLSARPMGRVMRPLAKMGGQFSASEGDRLPLRVHKAQLMPADITPDVASAQVKSAILLAGLHTQGQTRVREAHLTRDHSENMLTLFGASLERSVQDNHHVVALNGPAKLTATDIHVPGDPSSAAFPMVAALIVPGSDVVLENVMLNRQRDGLIRVLREMGGNIEFLNPRQAAGEAVADIRVQASPLTGIEVSAEMAPDMIDEYPALAVAAACASGTTHMQGLAELRVKESDRLAAIADGLRANGVEVQDGESDLRVRGGPIAGGGLVATHHDHRIAMAFLCLGLAAEKPVSIDDGSMIATSFPSFFTLMNDLGAGF
jgi:3-phosphoshikimate 1-carboxyvinyltransferase